MLSFDTFEQVIEDMESMADKADAAMKLGINLYEFCIDDYENMIINILEDCLCDGNGLIRWWVIDMDYGRDGDINVGVYDDDGHWYVTTTLKELWFAVTGEWLEQADVQ